MKNRCLALVVILLSSLLFGSCGKRENQPMPSGPLVGGKTSSVWDGRGNCYKKEVYDYEDAISGIWGSGGDKYVIANCYDNNDSASFEIVDGKGKILYSTLNGNLLAVAGCSSGIWVAEASFNPTDGQEIVLKKLAPDGGLVRTVEFSDIITITGYVEDMAVDADGNVFILADGKLFAMEDSGKLLSEFSFKIGVPLELAMASDGTICAKAQSSSGKAVYSLDAKTGKPVELMKLGEYAIHNGDANYYLYLSNNEGIWGLVSPDSGAYEPVIIWSECSIDFVGLKDIFSLNEEKFLCLDSKGAYTLVPALPGEIAHKTAVKLACISPLLNKAVEDFNSKSDSYWVDVQDYSQAGTVSRADAIKLLNTEIIGGNTPDLILFSDMSMFPYTERGVMADMYKFMDSDTEIDRNDFILLDKFETDGKLFYVAPGFDIELVFGLYSTFGDRCGWTLDVFVEMQKSSKSGREVFPGMSKEYFFRCVMRGYLQDAIDWGTGTCDFDNEDFISILNAAASISPSVVTEFPFQLYYQMTANELASGERLTYLSRFYSVSAIADAEHEAGERLSVIGWPSVDGKCGTLLDPYYPLGICDASKNKDGAWQFVKFLLLSGQSGVPIYKERLNEDISATYVTTKVPIMSRDDADRLFALLDAIEIVDEKNDDVMTIIQEEAGAFFAGVRNANETAAIVNSRIGILVAERS